MRYLIIDGNHTAGRCRATMKELTTSDGTRAGVVYGFIQGLSYLKNVLHVDYSQVIVCWDAGHAEGRKKLFPGYKGSRLSSKEVLTPEEEIEQREYWKQLSAIHEALGLLGIRQVKVKGVEADDLIGIFSRFYKEHQVIIHSGDHDMHQLADEKTMIFDPFNKKAELYDLPMLLEKWRVKSTEEMIIYKCIVGDKSDDIPGISGYGDVWATRCIPYLAWSWPDGTIVRNAVEADPKHLKKITELTTPANLEILNRNAKLMRIPRSWDESFLTADQAEEALVQISTRSVRDMASFIQFLQKWELKSILEKLHYW